MSQRDPGPGDLIHGIWTSSLDGLISYRYVGCQSRLVDRTHAIGTTMMRPHLRSSNAVLAAPLAISMLDTAGICIDRHYHLGLTQVDLQLFEPGDDVRAIRTVGDWVREGRTQSFTECRFEDADRSGRVIGVGAANWAVIGPTPPGFMYTDPGSGLEEGPDTPSIIEAFELEPVGPGRLRLPALSPRVGAVALHHGPMLVGLEQAALSAPAGQSGVEMCAMAVSALSVRIVRAGKRPPFDFSAEAVTVTTAVIGVRAQMTDSRGDLVALAHLTYR